MKKYILAIILGLGLLVPVGNVSAIKCEAGSLREGADVENVADCNVAEIEKKEDQLPARVQGIVNVLMALLGIVAVGVIIYGGAQMVISQGDASKVQTGRQAIIYGVIGLVVALLAWAIVNFVIAAAGNANGGDSDSEEGVIEKNQNKSSLLV